ncbi:MAG TPA: hypothetical protein VIJ93_08905 [bacterium]
MKPRPSSRLQKKTNNNLPYRSASTVSRFTPAAEEDRDIVTGYRWGWYFLSAFIPFAGFFVAYFLYDQDSRDVRKVGRNCLLIGFLLWVVLPVLMVLCLLLVMALTAFSWISDSFPSAD